MEKKLIKNGLILTMATDKPEPTKCDILIKGSYIAQIGKDLSAEGVGALLMPWVK